MANIQGRYSLTYQGVNAPTPPNLIFQTRAPGVSDYIGYDLGTLWVNQVEVPGNPPTYNTSALYVLVATARQMATWIDLTAPAGSISITGDFGGPLIGSAFTFTGGTTGLNFTGAGTTETLGGTLNPAHGGTGVLTYTPNEILAAGATPTAALTQIPNGTATWVLTSNGAGLPSFQASAAGTVTGITADFGGTATGPDITLTGGTSGAIFTRAANTITESFNFLNLPATTATNGQVQIGGSAALHAYGLNNIFAGNSSGNFTLSGGNNAALGVNTLTHLTTGSNNVAIGEGALQMATTAFDNVAIGYFSMNQAVGASTSTGVGYGALYGLTSGSVHCAFGNDSLFSAAGTIANNGFGYQTLYSCATGDDNNAFGLNTLHNLTSGSFNAAFGDTAGIQYTSNESSNILLNSPGVTGDQNTLRIGTNSGSYQITKAFINGINGVTVTGMSPVFIDPTTSQLGTIAAGPIGVPNGGTGDSTFTPYAPILAGTTATGPFQQALTNFGTSGYVLTSTGSSSVPTWQAVGSGGGNLVNVQSFITPGSYTYTPTAGMTTCIVEVIGGGGGSGGAISGTSTYCNATGGAGAGAYGKSFFTAATIGASQSLVVGGGGAFGAAGALGSTGGTSSFGSFITCTGGVGSQNLSTAGIPQIGGVGGTSTGANIVNISGQSGGISSVFIVSTYSFATSGMGGSTIYGSGGTPVAESTVNVVPAAGIAGNPGLGYGGGGSGSCSINNSGGPNPNGGSGFGGCVLITEFF